MLLAVTGLMPVLIAAAPKVRVEHVATKPKPGGALGTVGYEASTAEVSFMARLSKDELTTGGMMEDYVLSEHDRKFVGWFGIVREVVEQGTSTKLLVEHKGFDGLTDAHIMALDFNGAGDFTAVIPGVGHKIDRLTLVKIYGTVTLSAGQPQVAGEFVRNWHWGSFTFIAAWGTQHGSEVFRELNTVPLDQIYEPYPTDAYYVRRLGKR